MLQHSLVGELYRVLYEYCQSHKFPGDPSMEETVATWEKEYLPLRDEVESTLQVLVKGKAIHQPMALPEPGGSTMSIRSKLGAGRTSSQNSVPRVGSSPQPHPLAIEDSPPVHPARPGAASTPPASRPRVSSAMSIPSHGPLVEDEEPPPVKPPRSGQSSSMTPFGSRVRTHSSVSNGSASVGAFGRSIGSVSSPSAIASTPRRDSSQSTPYLTPVGSSQSLMTPQSSQAVGDYFGQSRDRRESASSLASTIAGKKKPPAPPVKKKPPTLSAQFATALYDFAGQSEGDLSFREGDQIRIVKKSDSTDDWWLGELRGGQGSFPANYVSM